MIDLDFWSGRRVFVTGHTGFKGAWLSILLQRLGAEVTGFSLPAPSNPSLFDGAHAARGIDSVSGDVRDLSALTRAMEVASPEIVLHLAAQSLVRPSYEDPVTTYATNVQGSVHVLEAVRQTNGVRAVVMVTSDKCYENNEWPWGYRESDRLGGKDPYSNSKACAELVTAGYRASFFPPRHIQRHGVGVATARAGNVIGGGDWSEMRIVPDLMRGFLGGESVVIRSPCAIRPWQHVLDPLTGYMMLAERLWHGEAAFASAWNFGPVDTDARPVSFLADRLAAIWGDGASWHVEETSDGRETGVLRLDSSQSRQQLKWHPQWDVNSALEHTAQWYRAYGRDSGTEAVRAATESDIESYLARLS
ncbi:MAG TPA: CDP-glucose 4,6-dehydratase [Gemmatimonadaceae bacterium]